MRTRVFAAAVAMMCAASIGAAQQQPRTPPTPAQSIRGNLQSIDGKLLEMAKDWPADKYDYKLKPEMRSFGEVMVHIVAGNIYAAKVARGDKNAKWDELDASQYKTKDQVVALLEKDFADSEAAAKAQPDNSFTTSLRPWIGVIEHSGEHYGLLVAYYRANGMVPPETRKNPQG
jgi:hypothetical protein